MKYLKYDESTGNIYDGAGTLVYTLSGLVPVKVETKSVALELVKQGVTVDEIIKLKNSELI